MNKSKENTLNIYIERERERHPWTFKHIYTDTHIHINTLFVIQGR